MKKLQKAILAGIVLFTIGSNGCGNVYSNKEKENWTKWYNSIENKEKGKILIVKKIPINPMDKSWENNNIERRLDFIDEDGDLKTVERYQDRIITGNNILHAVNKDLIRPRNLKDFKEYAKYGSKVSVMDSLEMVRIDSTYQYLLRIYN